MKKVLDNGLTLVVKPEKGSGIVAVIAMIKTGTAQESIQNAGIGNYVAQLLLASTRMSSAEEVAAVADGVGGNIAAQWHQDFAEIRTVTTSVMFNRAMSLIGECITDANFEGKWVEEVRTDLTRRINAQSDDVFEKAYLDLKQQLYEDNGYKRPELGFARTIKLANTRDLTKFHSTYYVPNNIVIAVAGDVTVDQAVDRAEKAFAGIPKSQLPTNRGMPDEELDRSKFHASEVDLGAACLMMGWLAPSVNSEDYPAVSVLANALGGGKGSIFFRELRQKRGLGYDVGVMYPRLQYQSHLVAYIITDPFKFAIGDIGPELVLDDVKNAMLEQVEQVKDKPLSEKDLERAKGYTVGSYTLSHQHMLDRAFELGWLETVGASYQMYAGFPDAVEKVTSADVQRVAKKYLTNYAAVLYLPKAQSSTDSE
ncbi:insulinase family protein [bacterium]|nr:insulinase family protein [bacterium]